MANKHNYREIAETIGLLSVVLSVIFVGFELRQSNRIAIATAENELRSSQRDFIQTMVEDRELSNLIEEIGVSGVVPPEDQSRYDWFVTWNFSIWASGALLYDNGLLSDYSLNVLTNTVQEFTDVNPPALPIIAYRIEVLGIETGQNALWDVLVNTMESKGY